MTSRSTRPIRCSRPRSSSATSIPNRPRALYKKSGPFGLDPAAHLGCRLPGRCRCRAALPAELRQGRHHHRDQARARRRLLVRGLEQAALLAVLLGRPRRRRTRCTPPATVDRGMERHALHAPGFRQDGLTARAELDEARRKAMYHDMAVIVRDEGGCWCRSSMISSTRRAATRSAATSRIPTAELMDGYALRVLAERRSALQQPAAAAVAGFARSMAPLAASERTSSYGFTIWP